MIRLLLLPLLVAACNESGGTRGLADGSGDVGDATADSADAVTVDTRDLPTEVVDRVCRPYADVACEHVSTCTCPGETELAECLRTAIEDCARGLGVDGPQGVEFGLADGTLVINDTRVADALGALESIALDCANATSATPSERIWDLSTIGLPQAVASTVPIGSPCDTGELNTAYCADGDGLCDRGVCVALVDRGETCMMLGPRLCVAGTFCDGERDWEWSADPPRGTCVPLGSLAQGAECGEQVECVAGLACLDGVCGTPPTEGMPCPDRWCVRGLVCDDTGGIGPRCRSGAGDVCYRGGTVPLDATGCGYDWTCWFDTPLACAPPLDEGDPCGVGDLCGPGLSCLDADDGSQRCRSFCESDDDCPGDKMCVWNACADGPIPRGGACDTLVQSHDRCDDGLVCTGSDTNQTCTDPPGLSELCAATNPPCAGGLVCRDGQCVEPPSEGESCADISPPLCGDGLQCRTDLELTCTALPEEGELCVGQCSGDLYCTRPEPGAPTTCSPTLPGDGEPCGHDGACAEGLSCRAPGPDPVCRPGLPGENEPCFANQECADGLLCLGSGSGRACVRMAVVGEPCVRTASWATQPCEPGSACMCEGPECACDADGCEEPLCRPFFGTGEPCFDDPQCGPSGFCARPETRTLRVGVCAPRRTTGEACIGERARQCEDGLFCQGPGAAGTCVPEICTMYGW